MGSWSQWFICSPVWRFVPRDRSAAKDAFGIRQVGKGLISTIKRQRSSRFKSQPFVSPPNRHGVTVSLETKQFILKQLGNCEAPRNSSIRGCGCLTPFLGLLLFYQLYRNIVSELLSFPLEVHNIGNSMPYSFRTVFGFFYVPQSC